MRTAALHPKITHFYRSPKGVFYPSEARLRPSKLCPGVSLLSAFPYRFPVPRYGTFPNEKFFRILGGENAKTEWRKNLTQVHQISNCKNSSPGHRPGLDGQTISSPEGAIEQLCLPLIYPG